MQGGGCAARVANSNPCIPTLNPPRQPWPNHAASESGDTFEISGRVRVHVRRIRCGAQQCERAGMGLGIISVHLGLLPTVPGAPKSPLANTRGVSTPVNHKNRASKSRCGANQHDKTTATSPYGVPQLVRVDWCGAVMCARTYCHPVTMLNPGVVPPARTLRPGGL